LRKNPCQPSSAEATGVFRLDRRLAGDVVTAFVPSRATTHSIAGAKLAYVAASRLSGGMAGVFAAFPAAVRGNTRVTVPRI
jgi:hypothetical protein